MQNETLSEPLHNNTKKGQNLQKSQKSVSVELSTVVVKVDIKVTSASLTQNQCIQCVTPSLMHVEIPRQRDATELNNEGVIKLGDVYYQTEPILSFLSKEI